MQTLGERRCFDISLDVRISYKRIFDNFDKDHSNTEVQVCDEDGFVHGMGFWRILRSLNT